MKQIGCIIAGSRDFNDYDLLAQSVDKIFNDNEYALPEIEIISGNADGADKMGEKFAKKHGMSVVKHKAKWRRYGKLAGHIRNCEMAFLATVTYSKGILIAFWDNNSPGTKHMIKTAIVRNLDVYVVDINTSEISRFNYATQSMEKYSNN